MNQPYPDEWLTQPWGLARLLLIEAWQAGHLVPIHLGRVPPVSWSNPRGDSIELQRLGEGSYGQVGKLTLRYLAPVRIISQIPLLNLQNAYPTAPVPFEQSCAIKFIREEPGTRNRVGELRVLNNIPASSNVIRYYGWHRLESPAYRYICLFMELCPGNLSDFIASRYYITLSAEQKRVGNWDIVKQVAQGLQQCHENNLVHRDLKIDNSISQCLRLN